MATRTIEVELPFEHAIIGFMTYGNRVWVAWTRDHPFHPFGTHEVMADKTCVNGGYFETITEALFDLTKRVPALRSVTR